MKRLLTFAVLLFTVQFCFASVHHVPGTYSTIQAALNACSTGDTVLVAAGTYYENITWPSTQSILLKSESGADVTIIDGSSINRVIKIDVGVDSTTIIKGFTIRNGYDEFGAGIRCIYNSSPTITQNIITQNTAYGPDYGLGGGIGIFSYSSPLIIDNIITYNSADSVGGGISCSGNSNPIIINNILKYNEADIGGGIHCLDHSDPVIDNNKIDSNKAFIKGGGIRCKTYSSPHIINNNITYNEAVDSLGGGISCCDNSSPEILNNIISHNTAKVTGGGITCYYNSSPLIKYNSIDTNSVLSGIGGGIFCGENSNPDIISNDLSGNSSSLLGADIFAWWGCTVIIDGNEIHGSLQSSYSIYLVGTSSVVRYNSITSHEGSGIGLWADFSNIHNNEISDNDTCGIVCEEGSNPIINYNNICDNDSFGVCNLDPSVIVNALHNWWGDPTGPYHPVLNPGGLCNPVSDYILFNPWIVPVELTSFIATCIAGEVTLDWTTATEVNNQGFEIERRIIKDEDQGEWILIGFREGYGTTAEPKEYSYTDNINGLAATSLAYRLKQIDFNGSFEYSEEVFVGNLAPMNFVLEQNYPNPFNPSTKITYGVLVKSHITLKIYDALGKEVLTLVNEDQAAGTYQVVFNAYNLASGIYVYRFQAVPIGRQAGDPSTSSGQGFVDTKRMVLLK